MSLLLSLRDNQFSGPVPSELGLLTNLEVFLNFRNNQLTSTIPTQLGLLSNLQELDFLNNQLTGPIPSELGKLTSMGHLRVANNSLSGTVPQSISELHHSPHTFNLLGNSLMTGVMPEALCTINATCIGSSLDECTGPLGLLFDCTSLLCGCDCNCEG